MFIHFISLPQDSLEISSSTEPHYIHYGYLMTVVLDYTELYHHLKKNMLYEYGLYYCLYLCNMVNKKRYMIINHFFMN